MKLFKFYAGTTISLMLLALTIALMIRYQAYLGYAGVGVVVLVVIVSGIGTWSMIEKVITRRVARAEQQRRLELDEQAQSRAEQHEQGKLELDRQRALTERLRAQSEYLKAHAEAEALQMTIEQYRAALQAGLHYPGPHGAPVHISVDPTTGQTQIRPTDYRALLPERAGQSSSRSAQDQIAVQGEQLPPPVDAYDLLQAGRWRPSPDALLLAVTLSGPLLIDYALAWHIALAGATGGGKTNSLRLILAQMVLFYDVYYISPAFAPVKVNREDWRQIQARLRGPVARQGQEIEQRLLWAQEELRRRQEAEFAGDHSWRGKRIYVVVDEYKEVCARYPDAPEIVSALLRQARQYDLFVVVAAQDFLIKSIGGDSGARDCYRTALYFGGDPYTARALLDIKGTLDYEEDLGKIGHVVVRTKMTRVSQARTPFMSNRAIYALLGEPADPILDDAPVSGASLMGVRNAPAVRTVNGNLVPEEMEPLAPNPLYPRRSAAGTDGAPRYVEAEIDASGAQSQAPAGEEDRVPSNVRPFPISTIQQPVEESSAMLEERSKAYRLSESEIGQFLVAYRISGSIDKALAALDRGTRYRQHARDILAAHNEREA